MSVTDALRAHHEQLQSLARDAEELADYLDFNVDRAALRDLLVSEFRLDLSNGRGHLWLETVIADIVRLVTGPIAGDVRELAEGIGDAAYGVDVEEAAAEAATEADQERRSHCLDCGGSTVGELYMLHDQLWAETGLGPDDGFLCIGCVEKRLGRRLKPDDFTGAPCNTGTGPWGDLRSERLRSRVMGLEEASAA